MNDATIHDDSLEARTMRRKLLAPGRLAGIDEAMIEQVVLKFYDRIRVDSVLGPIFNEAISDWGPHLAKMMDFWSSVLLLTGRYHGQPMVAHLNVPNIEPSQFPRWLGLFEQTVNELCTPEGAALFMDRAQRIAANFVYALQVAKGDLPPAAPGIRESDIGRT